MLLVINHTHFTNSPPPKGSSMDQAGRVAQLLECQDAEEVRGEGVIASQVRGRVETRFDKTGTEQVFVNEQLKVRQSTEHDTLS